MLSNTLNYSNTNKSHICIFSYNYGNCLIAAPMVSKYSYIHHTHVLEAINNAFSHGYILTISIWGKILKQLCFLAKAFYYIDAIDKTLFHFDNEN